MQGFGPQNLLKQETIKPANVSATLRRLGRYFLPYSWVLILVVLVLIGATYTAVRTPNLIGQSVDCYIVPGTAARLAGQASGVPGIPSGLTGTSSELSSTSTSNCWYTRVNPNATTSELIRGLGGLILLIVGLYVAGAVGNGLAFFGMTWMGQHVLRNLRVQVFHHLHKLSLNYYAENEAGNVMSRITNDMDTLNQVVSFALVQVVSGAMLIVWIAYTMLTLSWPYALLSLAVVPFMGLATVWISGQARKAFRTTRQSIGKVNAGLQESISGVREVQAFGREEANIDHFRESNAANRDANIKAVSFTAALNPTLQALGYLAVALVTVGGGIILLRGQTLFGTVISLGLIVTFLGYVQRFNQPIAQISMLWTNIQSAIAGAERIFGLLDTIPNVQDQPGAQPIPPIHGRVEFEHVSAAYEPGEPVLEDVSFLAEAGQTMAIVGPTGAGKTTIINLIPRFYDVTAGRITVDGYNVTEVTSASLRSQIGIVLQDTYLFSDTVMNNIRFGRPQASDEEVREAARLAHADDFIQRLPAGYETVLGEHGSGLSQGQRQLIAIARAALANPRILILDEATSSVDTRTERQIQQALDKLLEGRTSFVIAHRLSTIRGADQVLVIENGRIIERGRHEELLRRRGAYYTLYMRQFRQEEPAAGGDGRHPAREMKPRLAQGGGD